MVEKINRIMYGLPFGKMHIAKGHNFMVQMQNAKEQLRNMKICLHDGEYKFDLWMAVQRAYDKFDAEGAFEIEGRLFGYALEEQAEYFICYDQRVSDNVPTIRDSPEIEYEENISIVAKILTHLKSGTRVDV